MVARALSQSKSAFRGARPFNPATDLNGVAHLLEEAFRPERNFPFSDLPVMREVGILLWTLNYAPGFAEPTDGFVWVEEGKIVGNLTLTARHGRNDRYYISNVAVKPEYQRQGIARALMQTAIDRIRQQQGRVILLNVRPNNPGAIKLYQDLGFNALEMRGEWTLASPPTPQPPPPSPETKFSFRRGGRGIEREGGEVRPLRSSDSRAVAELVRAATPARVQAYRSRQTDFELAWDERFTEALADFFTGQTTHRWALEREGKLAGLVLTRGQHFAASHRLAIQTHPEFRGSVEEELVAVALQDLARLPSREIRADAADSHPELIAALERRGFRFLNGLTLMELVL